MKYKVKLIGDRHVELGYELPRIPIKGEQIRYWEVGKLKNGRVFDVLWDLDNMEIWIYISNE